MDMDMDMDLLEAKSKALENLTAETEWWTARLLSRSGLGCEPRAIGRERPLRGCGKACCNGLIAGGPGRMGRSSGPVGSGGAWCVVCGGGIDVKA
jgi:hypothetical protein